MEPFGQPLCIVGRNDAFSYRVDTLRVHQTLDALSFTHVRTLPPLTLECKLRYSYVVVDVGGTGFEGGIGEYRLDACLVATDIAASQVDFCRDEPGVSVWPPEVGRLPGSADRERLRSSADRVLEKVMGATVRHLESGSGRLGLLRPRIGPERRHAM